MPRVSTILYASIIILGLFAIQPNFLMQNPDTFVHLSIGEEMLKTHHIVTTAVHAFQANLPYIPHEASFQLLIAFLFNHFGWNGLHTLFVVCLGFMLGGMYALVKESRQEQGLSGFPVMLHVVIIGITVLLGYSYMILRPQLLSIPAVIWYVVFLRRLEREISTRTVLGLLFVSLLVANVHGGVWPLLLVLFGICLVSNLVQKQFSWKKAWIFLGVGGVGLINPGGWHTITYFFTVNNSSISQFIWEWQPPVLTQMFPLALIFCLFVFGMIQTVKHSPFRLFFGLFLLVIGLSTGKNFVYVIAFLPYFLCHFRDRENGPWLPPKVVASLIVLGLFGTLLRGYLTPYPEPVTTMPVQEMNYILSQKPENVKVLADMKESGYAMFRGADVLADGRCDPFVSPASVDPDTGLTTLLRVHEMFNGNFDVLVDEVSRDHPDFLVVQKPQNPVVQYEIRKITQRYGNPVMIGDYGFVWDLRGK